MPLDFGDICGNKGQCSFMSGMSRTKPKVYNTYWVIIKTVSFLFFIKTFLQRVPGWVPPNRFLQPGGLPAGPPGVRGQGHAQRARGARDMYKGI